MFNLDHAIAEWRRKMIAGGIKMPVPLEELESHLREDIEQQVRGGATSEQAFAAAVKRMGDTGGLKREFEKVQDSTKARRQILRVSSVIGGTVLAYSAVFATWILARRAGRIEITSVEFLLVFGSMLATILFGLTGRYFARFLPVVLSEWLQAAMIVAAIFVGASLLRLVWSSLMLEGLVHVQIVLLWTMSPTLGGAHCLSEWCDRCAAARKQMKPVNA
jgi:hypothetical protein